ncbi:MAG: site-specific tyrosine recombinase XerD [Herpetosiphon sp.]
MEVIQHGKSAQTRRAYRSDIEDWLCFLLGRSLHLEPGNEPLINAALARIQQVTERDVTAYRAHLLAGNLAPATVNRRLTPLRLLFRRMHRYQLIAVDPLEEVRGERLQSHSDTVWFTSEQARRLISACTGDRLPDLRDLAIVRLMIRTGLRSRELLGLNLGDLATIGRHNVIWVQGKGGARERIKLPPDVRQTLDEYMTAAAINDGAVFRRVRRVRQADGNMGYRVDQRLSYPGLVRILRTRFAQAGLLDVADRGTKQPSAHSLRHSFVTLALQRNIPLTKVQAVVRHADPRTTMRYAHDLDDLEDNGVDGLTI